MIKILIVEDEKITSDLLSHSLKGIGYNVDQAYNGQEGLQKVIQNDYHLILSDVVMPELDGLEMTKQIRDRGIKTPICILTSQSEQEKQLSAFKYGIEDYYLKPFTAAIVTTKIKNMINRLYGDKIKEIEAKRTKDIKFKNEIYHLSVEEYTIFKCLFSNKPNNILTSELYKKIYNNEPTNKNDIEKISVIVSSLCQKLASNSYVIKGSIHTGFRYEES